MMEFIIIGEEETARVIEGFYNRAVRKLQSDSNHFTIGFKTFYRRNKTFYSRNRNKLLQQ